MYIRAAHAETSLVALRRIIRQNPLGQFTTAIDSSNHDFLQSSHIPFVLDIDDESSDTELGRLRGHLARANPQSKAIIEEVSRDESGRAVTPLQRNVLVIFTSPVHHYVTPKFYTETKPATGKVVPTWNYSAVQVYGKATVYIDSKSETTGSFLKQQIHDLSEFNEQEMMGFNGQGYNPGPWRVSDAPEKYIDLLKKAIIGVEIEVTKMEGKFKMSQEMSEGDINGVVQGFNRLNTEVGRSMGEIVDSRRTMRNQT